MQGCLHEAGNWAKLPAMRSLLVLSILVLSTPLWAAVPTASASGAELDPSGIPITTSPVANIFIHPLIAFPDRAFAPGKDQSRMDEWFVTGAEFYKALESLQGKGYILVKPSEVYVQGPDGWTVQAPPVPEGRKALILSIDDLNYYRYMRNNGTVSRLLVDNQGRLVARTFLPAGGFRDDLDLEAPQILEGFLKEHPDFSFHGARGMIGLTGYAGVFGWPTQNPKGPQYTLAVAEATKTANALKVLGWEFASHSYAHQSSRSQKDDAWLWSEARWKAEVEPIIGPTPLYVFPFGENWWRSDVRWKALQDSGFRVFFGVEKTSNQRVKDGLPIVGRVPLDGRSLRHRFGFLSPFLDARAVWDPIRPPTMHY
jgi:hypothetical protein